MNDASDRPKVTHDDGEGHDERDPTTDGCCYHVEASRLLKDLILKET